MDLKTNPYASQVGDKNPIAVIAATAASLERICGMLGAEGIETPLAPGKWNARQIVCHLADSEVVFGYRLRQALAEDFHVIQPFDQDKFARTYAAYDLPGALSAFSAVRRWNISFIRGLDANALSKRLTHPERGDMSIQTVIETMAGHDINHLRQLEAIASRHSSHQQ